MSPDEQIHQLRNMASGKMADWVFWGAVVVAVTCLGAGLWSGGPPYFMVALFLGVVAVSARQTQPHIRRAALALDAGVRSRMPITIEVTQWSDTPTYHALVPASPEAAWRMEFIPQGWTPEPGELEAEAYCLPGVAWPALLIAEKGIIYPRYTPKAAAECTTASQT